MGPGENDHFTKHNRPTVKINSLFQYTESEKKEEAIVNMIGFNKKRKAADLRRKSFRTGQFPSTPMAREWDGGD